MSLVSNSQSIWPRLHVYGVWPFTDTSRHGGGSPLGSGCYHLRAMRLHRGGAPPRVSSPSKQLAREQPIGGALRSRSKDTGFRVFSPLWFRWCRRFGLKTPLDESVGKKVGGKMGSKICSRKQSCTSVSLYEYLVYGVYGRQDLSPRRGGW